MRKKKTSPTVSTATVISFACDLMIAAAFVIMSITMYNLVTFMIKYGK